MLRRIFTQCVKKNVRKIRVPIYHFSDSNVTAEKGVKSLDLEEKLFGFNRTDLGDLKSKVPHISIESFVSENKVCQETAESIVAALRDYGCVAIKDPRVNLNSNTEFVNMMSSYFNSRSKMLSEGQEIDEMYPEFGYETGITPEFTERARKHFDTIASLREEHWPLTPQPPPKDSKWRYMYKVGDRKDSEDFAMPKVVPKDYPQFEQLSDEWSNSMVQTLFSVSQLLAIGLGLEKNSFLDKMLRGAHILGPTGSDIEKYDVDTILAGFHYDFCMLTIHGKSNYPGLFIWLRDGTKLPVVLEDGYLLIQSGLELEMFTGGLIKAGMHEVTITQKAKDILEERKKMNIPNANWRVSSTVFGHVEHDCVIEPLGHFATEENLKKYPPITGLDLMKRELMETDML
jgi:isopenicillin N synthase-like dioxygenase